MWEGEKLELQGGLVLNGKGEDGGIESWRKGGKGWDMVMGREINNDDFPQNTSAVERKLVSHSSAKLVDKEELASYHYPISIKPDLVRSITLSTVDALCSSMTLWSYSRHQTMPIVLMQSAVLQRLYIGFLYFLNSFLVLLNMLCRI